MISILFFFSSFFANIENYFVDNFTNKNYPNIIIAGDVMLSRSVGAMTKTRGTEYITNSYNPFANENNNAFVVFNLESPFSLNDRDKSEPTFYFASNPRNIAIIQWLIQNKTGVISLANNHIFNAGFEGFRTTLKIFEENKIASIGLSKNKRQEFIIIEKEKRKYCFGGYSYDGRKYYDPKTQETWWVNSLEDAKNDIFLMNQANCDEKIFVLHWGAEYKFSPSQKQRDLAYFLIDNGATLIAWWHSHILGETEIYKWKPIFYSFGNAMFDQEWGRKGCQSWMDCIVDNKGKKVVPTHIGTSAKLVYPYTDFSFSQWEITVGKLSKYP